MKEILPPTNRQDRAVRGMPLAIEDDDFDREIALVRQNQELMELLDQRPRASKTYTTDEA